MRRSGPVFLLITFLAAGNAHAGDAPAVKELRTQRVGEAVYFHVRFATPADMRPGPLVEQAAPSTAQRWKLSRLPHLVAQDGKSRAVYHRLNIPDYRPGVGFDAPSPPEPAEPLDFVGKVTDPDKARFRLLYPTAQAMPAPPPVPDGKIPPADRPPAGWVEAEVELDFAHADRVAPLDPAERRKPREPLGRNDLEGLWASAQAAHFAVLEALTSEFSFYGFAAEATARRYGVRAPMLDREPRLDNHRDRIDRELYETTTGSAAITQSLQMHRLLDPGYHDRGERTITLSGVPGIDIAEHAWEKMIGDRKPAPEPLAKLVPHDNYYVHFSSVRKFIEFAELMEEWGGNVTRAYEVNSREYDLRRRYERQLCVRGDWQAKAFGPAVVRGLAVTGSDPYLREGSDVTLLFHVADRSLFLAAVEPYLAEARRKFGGRLREGKEEYHGVPVETFVTPYREVSLNRAGLGNVVVYSNSPAALRRVIDAEQGRLKALGDSLDFQYMRTVFRAGDEHEDGFAFLSDPFIRQLVGPVSKIKEKRRLEALTSLQMVTNAALFTAWETGKPPADHAALLSASALKPAEITTPDGKGVVWDGQHQVAVSDAYSTLHFPTPLVELAIDKITPAEQHEYLKFRTGYLNLWRKYFDPVGMRVSVSDRQVRLETYILPLIRSSEYDFMRMVAGGGTTKLDLARLTPQTLAQFTVHAADMGQQFINSSVFKDKGKMGDWAMIRVDDSPAFAKLAELWVRQEMSGQGNSGQELETLVGQLPVTLGIPVQEPKEFGEVLDALAKSNLLGATERKALTPYRGVAVTRVTLREQNTKLYHAPVGDVWYVSLSEKALHGIIDHDAARKGKPASKEEPVEFNGSVYLAPRAFQKARPALGYYLEWEAHRRALLNEPIWYALYRGGLVAAATPEKARREMALRYLGFVPVSPDGATYDFDTRAEEVVNRRHGSLRRPHWHADLDEAGLLARFLEQFPTLRADLRFREDGVHTTVTIERKRP